MTLARIALAGLAATPVLLSAAPVRAQSVVSACAGVSLPRSVVTDILAPVAGGIVAPIEDVVNPITDVVRIIPLVGRVIPPLRIDLASLLADAAAGDPVSLSVIGADGRLIGPDDRCDTQADSFSLRDPAGLSIGGNRVSGLGTGPAAFAGTGDAIALGDGARADAGAGGAIAIGAGARAERAGSVAIGAGSRAGRGALSDYAAAFLAAPQSSAGEIAIGAAGAERQITHVAAGSAPTDAVNVAQLLAVADLVEMLADTAVVYSGPDRARVALGGAGGTVIANLRAGRLAADSSEAVNGAQLHATNEAVAANSQAITNLTLQIGSGAAGPVRYSDPDDPERPNGGTPTNNVTLAGAAPGPVGLHNVADGRLEEGSADAVTGGQLHATNQQVAANSAAITDHDARIARNSADIAAQGTQIAQNTSDIAAHDARISQNSADIQNQGAQIARNTSDIAAQGVRIAENSAAIAEESARNDAQDVAIADARRAADELETAVRNGAIGPVQYSHAESPETPNGGIPTNHLTLVGGGAGPVALHNVADGRVAEGSTDAVNGGQLHAALSQATLNALLYDTDEAGNRTNRVTLTGGEADAPVLIANLAAGAVHADSREAVNGAQLHAANQATGRAQARADQAHALAANGVQYDADRASVTFGGEDAAPVRLRNVAAGVAPTDAVNLAQLDAGLAAVRLETAQNIAALRLDMRGLRRDAFAGTAGALALSGLPQPYEPGRGMLAMGVGTYMGEQAFALGGSAALADGQTVLRIGASLDTRGRAGANAGIGWQFR